MLHYYGYLIKSMGGFNLDINKKLNRVLRNDKNAPESRIRCR